MLSSIKAKNFMSWKSLEFNVKKGVTLIDGHNLDDGSSEGSGKSAILNALCWTLFGKLPKDTKIDDVIKEGEKGCSVEVVISANLRITRSRKPNTLDIVNSTGDSLKGKDAKETQSIIEQHLGLTFETFCQTVYFPQNYSKKFITSNQEDKGKILSEIQDLSVFDKARKLTVSRIKEQEREELECLHNIQLAQSQVDSKTKNLKDLQEVASRIHKEKELKLETLRSRLKSAEEEYNRQDHYIKDLKGKEFKTLNSEQINTLEQTKNSLGAKLHQVDRDIHNIDSILKERAQKVTLGKQQGSAFKRLQSEIAEVESFIQNPEERCKACGSITGQGDVGAAKERLKVLKSNSKEIMDLLKSLSVELKEEAPSKEVLQASREVLRGKLNDIDKVLNKSREQEVRKSQNTHDIQRAYDKLDRNLKDQHSLKEDLKSLEDSPIHVDTSKVEKLEAELTVLKGTLEKESLKHDKIKGKLIQLESLKKGFKDVKSYVFNSILNEINSKTQQYVEKLFEMPINVKFSNDNMKISTDIKVNGVERGLGLLSGGQFRRVSLATDLALSDIISARKGTTLGVLVLDEYFKDLSEYSMEKCLNLLEGKNQPVILIEHNSIFKNIVNNTFYVEMENGTSYEKI